MDAFLQELIALYVAIVVLKSLERNQTFCFNVTENADSINTMVDSYS